MNQKYSFPAIYEIIIDKLFGKYNYYLPNNSNREADFSKLMIFYGDNGTGKTTILKLLYNLLSTETRKNHRTYVANVSFKRFEIKFTDGTSIIASRPNNNLIGSYKITVFEDKEEVLSVNLKTSRENLIKEENMSIRERRNYREYLQYLVKMNISLYFLSDDRKFHYISERSFYESDAYEYFLEDHDRSIGFAKPYRRRKLSKDILNLAKERAEKWLNLQISEALGKGEIDVNNIYTEIIGSIAKPSKSHGLRKKDISEIIQYLEKLSERSQKYSYFKIISPLNIYQIVKFINEAPPESLYIISSILEPYINGINAKLDALEDIYSLLNIFTETLNDFYFDKILQFKFNEGIIILTSEENELNVNSLSSGEKQLLMLFCNIVSARENTCIFMIDEPEISLNVKWQRKLIRSLIELTEEKQVQFLLATHSIELLSQYRTHVAKLDPKKITKSGRV